ncbi:MAG: hypothetical protein H7222_13910 [Methylotenera sp.]|nr:hypothetical protein [Oligoflexia bacterium]
MSKAEVKAWLGQWITGVALVFALISGLTILAGTAHPVGSYPMVGKVTQTPENQEVRIHANR